MQPLVSIGVPIYNPGLRLSSLIEKINNQTYKNIEIIISDNGSSDGIIKKNYSQITRKKNIKVYQSDINRGSIWNFNKVYKESKGKYFCWFAIDDDRDNDFISECVDYLEKNLDVVLCHCITNVILEDSNETIASNSMGTFEKKNTILERYKETLINFPATSIYGMYRSKILRKTSLFQKLKSGLYENTRKHH